MNSTQLHENLKDLHAYANDTDVMFGVQAHDRRALEKLYLTYYGPLARFLSRVVAQTGAVDEIINDSFVTIWKSAGEFRGESRAAAWIFGIAYRTAQQSKELHRGRGPLRFADRLERRLNRLPLAERVTLALAYQMRFSIDEIAEITQVAPVIVRIRMLHARIGFR
ncbi:MAG TPA: sigma factor [Steroidobacteraceae bacterium]|nr:sigma factor [Steroidobacteraceae bacterium]